MSDQSFEITNIQEHGGPGDPRIGPVTVITAELAIAGAKDGVAGLELNSINTQLAVLASDPALIAAGAADPGGMLRVGQAMAAATVGPSGTVASQVRVAEHIGRLALAAKDYEFAEERVKRIVTGINDGFLYVQMQFPWPSIALADGLGIIVEGGHNLQNIAIGRALNLQWPTWDDVATAFNSAAGRDPIRQERFMAQVAMLLGGISVFAGTGSINEPAGTNAAKLIDAAGTRLGAFKAQGIVFQQQRLTNQAANAATNTAGLVSGLDRASLAPDPKSSRGTDPQAPAVVVRSVKKNGKTSYVVYLPGTQSKDTDPTKPTNFPTDVDLASGDPNAATAMAMDAMQRAGIPPDAPVMLVGYSQGGLAAARLASDPEFLIKYNVKAVMTMGSPIADILPKVPERIATLSYESTGDVVTGSDGRRNPTSANHATITFEAPARSALEKHDYALYKSAINQISESKSVPSTVKSFDTATADFHGADAVATDDEYVYTGRDLNGTGR